MQSWSWTLFGSELKNFVNSSNSFLLHPRTDRTTVTMRSVSLLLVAVAVNLILSQKNESLPHASDDRLNSEIAEALFEKYGTLRPLSLRNMELSGDQSMFHDRRHHLHCNQTSSLLQIPFP